MTKSDLNDPQSRTLLKETMNDLLSMNVVPILNANDTVSEPYAPDAGDYVSLCVCVCVCVWVWVWVGVGVGVGVCMPKHTHTYAHQYTL